MTNRPGRSLRISTIILCVSSLTLSAACQAIGPSHASPEHTGGSEHADPHVPDGSDSGMHLQSPIDLPARPPTSDATHEIALHYDATAEHLIHRDHTIELEYDAGSNIDFDGRTYTLEQLHFHTPSEHLVAHQRFPVELHLVHHDDGGGALVVALLFQVGRPSAFVEQILADAPRDVGRIDRSYHVNAAELFPEQKHFYTYEGSLTTAPFTEGVQWLILSEHPTMSAEQVVRLLVLEGGNARSTQPIKGRPIDGL